MNERDAYLAAAEHVARARMAEAEAFLLHKAQKGVTDNVAKAKAIIETNSYLDLALAHLELARRALGDSH